MNDQYFKVREERKEYLGDRYFRWSPSAEKVVQVCINSGDLTGKGRGNSIGVYYIHRMTFFGNYMAMNYIEGCTKRVFDSKFKKAIQMLS